MDYIGNSALFYGGNETYILQLYERYLLDKEGVPSEWCDIFDSLQDSDDIEKQPSWLQDKTVIIGQLASAKSYSDNLVDALRKGESLEEVLQQLVQGTTNSDTHMREHLNSIRAIMLIRAYRTLGHFDAQLDPLKLSDKPKIDILDPYHHGFTDADWDRPIYLNYYLGRESATLREIISICRRVYCGSAGIEFMHVTNAEEKAWLQSKIEAGYLQQDLTNKGKEAVLNALTHADVFEGFLDKKYRGAKRFGLDGAETLVPMLEQIIKRGSQLELEEVVIGMAHRGRLNVLANVMQKPYKQILYEFSGGTLGVDGLSVMGDVKYHLGTSSNRVFDNKEVHLSLAPNPSHLEAVNTVVLGKVRAKQEQKQDKDGVKVMGILLHGDAAFIGQGIVAETFLLSQLEGYKTGGTIHIAINNQIGFTTLPSASRSSPYCTDIAKTIDAPVIHVNGDDPEACVYAARLATEYRQQFHKDIVIDLLCYRRHGHNEADEPMFTQPLMYKNIKKHPKTSEVYAKQLINEGVVSAEQVQNITGGVNNILEQALEDSKNFKTNQVDWLEGRWSGLSIAGSGKRRGETSISEDVFDEVSHAITHVPNNFHIHERLHKQIKTKQTNLSNGTLIDWGTAEALAFGSLLCESTRIRLSGEDSKRGTFSHRHAVWVDQEDEKNYIPLNNIRSSQAPLDVIDSPLSEFGLLGFEYGFAGAEPHSLVLWEAQFGDFANGAQVIIDQFIASGETKWLRMNGLVMLLPHGYEGQGPEHSSARLERYLQLSADDNWQVCNITTPANYFHALRRQVRRNFRKPLIVMSPKSLLRHPLCVSNKEDFVESTFHRVIPETRDNVNKVAHKDIRKVVICSGKIYYDLVQEADKKQIDNVVIMRCEQLYPFPRDTIKEELDKYSNADIIWCQEEPHNNGAWFFVAPLITEILQQQKGGKNKQVTYVGRKMSSSPATGYASVHAKEQQEIIEQALL